MTDTPYSCQFDTGTVVGGTYAFRSVATDNAGNSTTSSSVTNRVIDNTVSSVSVDDPGAFLSGTVVLKANAISTTGVSSVKFQIAPSGTSSWYDLCTDTASPYNCSLNTANITDGLFDLRAIMVDKAGKSTISAVVAARRIDNNPIRGYDAQTTSVSATKGQVEPGDAMQLTYSERANLSTISSGWTGSPLAVTVRIRDGALLGLSSIDDTVTVLRNGAAVNLGSVNLRQSYIGSSQTADFAATMTSSTTTVNGVTATRITLTLGSQTSGPKMPSVSASSVMIWTPSTVVTDLNGQNVSGTPISEQGSSDREF